MAESEWSGGVGTGNSRTLLLMRHADAEFGVGRDFDRPLSLRGREQARAAGRVLLDQHDPTLVLCSAAIRTQATRDLVLSGGQSSPEIVNTRALYQASAPTMLSVIQEETDKLAVGPCCVLVIAHEPTVSMLADNLAGPKSAPAAAHMVRLGVMTAGVAVLQFDTPWDELRAAGATLTQLISPPPA